MMEYVHIEKLDQQDIPALVSLLNSLVPWNISEEFAEESYKTILASGDSAVFAAKKNGKLIGTATAICCTAIAAKFLVIEDVIVSPEHTGNGIGTMLMKAVDVFAIEKKCQYAILVSSGHRTNAHRFYQKNGFIEDVRGFRKGYPQTPET